MSGAFTIDPQGGCHAMQPICDRVARLWTTILFAAVASLFGCRAPVPPRPEIVTTPRPPASFAAARRLAMDIHQDRRITFYCACGFDDQGAIDATACGYQPRNDTHRARRIEWEHIVPAAAFGRARSCWSSATACPEQRRRDGRRCCRKSDPEFRAMEADLANLVPAIGELNSVRADFDFGDIPGEPRAFGACDFEVDPDRRVVEVADHLRGDVARAYLYMHRHYPTSLPLSEEDIARFRAWHESDPPTPWERERARRIQNIQGVDPLAGL